MSNGKPLTVETLARAPEGWWDQAVGALGGYAFHGRGFAAASAELGDEPQFLVLRRLGDAVGYAVATDVRTRWRVVGWARDVLEFASPPVLAPGVTRMEAVDALQSFGASLGYGQLRIYGVCDTRAEDPYPRESDRVHHSRRLDYRVPLGADFATTLAAMSATHRRKVRKAMASGFTFDEQSTPEGAQRLYALHEQTMGRRQSMGLAEPPVWQHEDFLRRTISYLKHGILRLHFASLDGETQSGIGTMTFGKTSFYLVGGTSRAGYESGAAYAMFADTIQRLIASGVTDFNLGGTPLDARDPSSPDHGLYRFKAGYGAIVTEGAHVHVRLTAWRWWPAVA